MELLELLLLVLMATWSLSDDSSSGCRYDMIYPGATVYEYSHCVNGDLVTERCPTGSYFDERFLMCRHGKPPGGDVATKTGKCQRVGTTADLTDCSRFYYCDAKDGEMLHGSCTAGKIFDPTKFGCFTGKC